MAKTVLGKLGEAPVVMLCGPIAHWWDENWETKEHWDYVAWRNFLSDELVKAGYLVYRPHEAFKGTWNNKMQGVNNYVLNLCDFILNLNPGVPSDGTDEELIECVRLDKIVIDAPPPAKYLWFNALYELLDQLSNASK